MGNKEHQIAKYAVRMVPGGAQAELGTKIVRGLFGSTKGRTVLALGLGATVATGGMAFGTETDITVEGGTGSVTDVSVIFPDECHTAYTSHIEGATADFNKKFKIGPITAPTGVSDKEEFNGDLTSKICSKSDEYVVRVDAQNRKATVTIPASAYDSTVYMTDPTVNNFHTVHNGITMAVAKNVEDFAKVIPKIDFHGSGEGVVDRMRGLAFLAAQSTHAKACGNAAWPLLKPLEQKELQKSLAEKVAVQKPFLEAGKPPLKPSEINVVLPNTMQFTTQYEDKLNSISDNLQENNVTVTVPSADLSACKPATDVKVNMEPKAQ